MEHGLMMMYVHRAGTPSFVALGQVLRALGRGWRVCVIQFNRDPGSLGEVVSSRNLGATLEYRMLGAGILGGDNNAGRTETAEAAEAWKAARKAVESHAYRLVVLDGLTKPLNRGFLKLDDVIRFLEHRPAHVNVLITGANVPEALLEAADLVTDVVDATPHSRQHVAR